MIPNGISGVANLNQAKYLEDVKRVDSNFRKAAAISVSVYVILLCCVYWKTSDDSFEVIQGAEKNACLFSFSFLLLSLIGKGITIFWLEPSAPSELSGILIGSITVQSVALFTNAILASGYPVPVLKDPVFGNRVFIYRWCEWSPLAAFMTFLTASIDANSSLRDATLLAFSQGISTLMGLLLPYCQEPITWTIAMSLSFVLFLFLFPSLYSRRQTFLQMTPGPSAHTLEIYDRARLSYRLMLISTSAWSSLVVLYFIAGLGSYTRQEGKEPYFFQHEAFSMVWECVMDVILKNLYMNVIVQVHSVSFDDKERAERRLGELRRLMSAVWENSNDVICVSVRGMSGCISTMVSPVYMRLYHCQDKNSKAIMFDIDAQEVASGNFSVIKTNMVRTIDFKSLPEPRLQVFHDIQRDTNIAVGTEDVTIDDTLLKSLAGMIARAWNMDSEAKILTHRLLKDFNGDKKFTSCEANICYLESDAILMVIRDISERSKRFEAEKKMIFETTARQKDAEANRFTRHEVKNGLLAAIGLCENLKESALASSDSGAEHSHYSEPMITNKPPVAVHAHTQPGRSRSPDPKVTLSTYTNELDKTLKNVLDTILSEAMARDVIHGNYEPKMERVDIEDLLSSADMNQERFRLISQPSPLPSIYFDPQLLQYIYRNAVSNACKYGQKDGVVTSRVYFDEDNDVLRMDIENLPGEQHDYLLKLGAEACDAVFEPGKRLHEEKITNSSKHSAGDGAWIMHKCAETLKGKVGIKFEKHRTIFSFVCPAKRFSLTSIDPQKFSIPRNAWGVAIDDSKIQRKLLSKFLALAGVLESRQIIVGETEDQIKNFDSFVVQIVQKNPNDYFLIIVDENLDIIENGTLSVTVSGSKCVERIRRKLLPDQERRVLALVRSANDSSTDIALYNSRAHGFISKAPVRNSSVLESIAPIWQKRFKYLPRSQVSGNMPLVSDEKEGPMSDFACLVVNELQANLDSIDGLCSEESLSLLQRNWPFIWDKLHCLKGDLLSLLNTPSIENAVREISSMRGAQLPVNFVSRWVSLRSQISEIAGAIRSTSFLEDGDELPRAGEKRFSEGPSVEESMQKKARPTNFVPHKNRTKVYRAVSSEEGIVPHAAKRRKR